MFTGKARAGLWAWAIVVVAFLWIPIVVMGVYAFNSSNVQSWPIPGFSTHWFSVAWHDPDVRTSLVLSLKAGALATSLALLLGTAAAFALARFRFFGQSAISFVFVLPIALPGIITGMALNSFFTLLGVDFGLWTIVVAHATFCVVVVFNNVLARLRRTSGSYFEASADLGADGWQTFRFVTFPAVRTALVAGALLAFALSWDEIVVTYFAAGAQNTLPLLIFGKIRQGQDLPEVNAIALFVIALTLVPVFLAQRLTTGHETERTTAAAPAAAQGG